MDAQDHSVTAYVSDSGLQGIRDRITVRVLGDRTVVAAQSEIQDGQGWQSTTRHCSSYSYAREKALAIRIDLVQERGPIASPPAAGAAAVALAGAN